MSKNLRIFILEDQAADAELTEQILRKAGIEFTPRLLPNRVEFVEALKDTPPDLVIADYAVPGFGGLEALQLLRQKYPDTPFICVSGIIGEETAVELMKQGATDFVPKQKLEKLPPAVERALREADQKRERRQAEALLRDSESRFRAVFESAGAGIAIEDLDGRIVETNQALQQMLGYSGAELQHIKRPDFTHSHDNKEEQIQFERLLTGKSAHYQAEKRFVRRDGRLIWGRLTVSMVRDAARKPQFALVLIEDITERQQAEEAYIRYAGIVESSTDAIISMTFDGIVFSWNPAAERLYGYSAQEANGRPVSVILPPDKEEEFLQSLERIRRGETIDNFETTRLRKDGTIIQVSVTTSPIKDLTGRVAGVSTISRDITERQILEAQLRQSQKLESIGQLAGGVAHDFNNILTVIQGHTSLLSMTDGLTEEALDSARQISLAAERAANLTRQLLTFSRRQVLQPKNLDLNEVVSNMTKMLQRLLGEDITLQVNYAPSRPAVHADPGMMEQILLNLSVNARDAMPRGGSLFINTSLVTLDEVQAHQTAGAAPGDYVCLTVKDTGSGIAPENLPHIFEPFFTTKDVGKGTGLGLATVYGIVQQHHGWIKVDSKPRQETVFQVFLPAVASSRAGGDAAGPEPKIRGGTETILLVEDEGPLRMLVRNVMERYGYHVLEASSGVDALPIWLEHKNEIHLLLTDMVMPHGVSGRELAERLRGDKPDLKVIYSSGYSLAVVGTDMVLQEGLNFLQKPYNPRKLAQAIRDCLDG